jgi:predicted AAA+ superfamily ATPase
VDAAFALGAELRAVGIGLRRRDYLARAARGGYPEAVRRETPRRRERFLDSYITDLIVRDVQQVAQIEQSAQMRQLLALLAGQTAGLLNIRRLAGELAISAPTVQRYLDILETVFLVRTVPAWSANVTTRTVAAPKIIFTDPGIASFLSGGPVSDVAVGALLENFVLGELARQLSWSRTSARLHHFRDRDQHEVDAILEDNAGRIVGVEVKASETIRSDDFRGLRILQRRLGERFRAGFVLYCGAEALSFGTGCTALPISALWTSGD